MFGKFCEKADDWLGAGDTRVDRPRYAAMLLEELLNRAAVLNGVWTMVHECGLKRDDGEYVVRLERLKAAVSVFLLDVAEAEIRARRARLVARGDDGELTADNLESEESLAAIGGAPVTEEV